MVRRAMEQEGLITNLQNVVKELQQFLSQRGNFVPHDIPSPVLEPLSMDDTHLHMLVVNDKHIGEDEYDEGNEKSNMFSQMKHKTRKRVKTTIMKTPWTTYLRKKRKRC